MSPAGRKTLVALAVAALAVAPAPADAQAGSVTGTVWDSISGDPLADAAVFLWDTSHRGVTDDEGRFRIDDVPAGDYTILFFHTRLGELGVSPGPQPLRVEAGGEPVEISLATPSMATLVSAQCLMEERPEGAGAIAGRTLDATSDVTLGGAMVTLSWQADGNSPPETIVLSSGNDGWFRSCDVPSDIPVLISADYYGRESERREIRVPAGGYVDASTMLADLDMTHVIGTLIDAESERPVDGAEAWLRGTTHRTVSDGSGRISFGDVAPGTYMMMTNHIAYGTKMDTLVVPSGVRLEVAMRLNTRAIEIAPLTVTADEPLVELARIRGGIVLTTDQIDKVRQQSRDASDIIRSLHVPGVIVRHQSNGTICVGFSTGQVKMYQTGCVEMMIYVNGIRATDADLALRLPPDAIERMVVYKPVEAGNLFGLGGGNGVWMIYTRGN